MMADSSITYLSRYLEVQWDGDDDFPWNKLTCLALVCYVVKKNHRSSQTISSLDQAAKQYLYEESPMERISQVFANSFIPEAKIHFNVPKLDDLSDNDRNLSKNEILAGFLDFLVQILHYETNVDTVREQRYVPLGNAILFLLAILGDKPFDGNNQHSAFEEQVNDLLAMSEALVNEAGSFIYWCVFTNPLVEGEVLTWKINALLEKFEILNVNIKQHCIKFSELPLHDVPQSTIVNSFFIIHSLVDDLDNLLSHENFSMNDHIGMLHDELRSSQDVLKFIEGQKDDDPMKESLGQIRDLAYEAEYLVNSYVVGNIHVWYLDLRLPYISQKIMVARERLQQIKEMQQSQVNMHNGGEISYVSPTQAENDNHFVELQHNTTGRILADLVGKSKSRRQTVLIFGMPGLGKTTIANKLYRCNSVSHYFDRRVWCIVSQTYSVRSLLINILTHLARDLEKDEILKRSDAELGVDIHKSLMQRRYLIVLDDVWHRNAWYDLQRYFPDDGNGSRVIITSRIKDVAPDGSIYHTLPLFSKDQCWDLLEKKIFLGESCPAELIKTGKTIAAKCSGIPLAVIITAGILTGLEREEDAWKRVEQQLDAFLLDGVSDYRKILELSYEHLPLYMKPCFLYFAAFPEDSEISINKLAWSWIAEGFIRKIEGKSQEQIAELYLLELMNRSLVIPGKRRADGRTKTCRVHDLLHDICIRKANEENFLNSNNELSIFDKHHRSYLSSMMNTGDMRPFGLHCRSLIGGLPYGYFFQTRALLKVLDIRPNKFQTFDEKNFDLPIQLRYLGVNHLPNVMVTNLDNLEFINVVNSSQVKVPSIILRMKKLRHLLVRKEAIFEDDYSISETTKLRTLLFICIDKRSDEVILRYSPHLQKLKLKISGKKIFPDLSFLEELETLKIVFESSNCIFNKKVTNLNFPLALKNLCLFSTYIDWKNMSVIGRLPNLCVLKLEMFAFVGEEWETLDGEFEELRFLKISQSDLKQWTTCSEHFPKLERLVLHCFTQLQEIPCDLGYISTLQRIDVKLCLTGVNLSVVRIEQEQHEYGNEELMVNITTQYWTKHELVELYRQTMENAKNVSAMGSVGNHIYELNSIIGSRERDFLVRDNGEQVKVDSLKGKFVGLYFSTFRHESCQLFTKKLVTLYNAVKKYGHFEIVHISGDGVADDESSTANFFKFPWLAVPLTDSNKKNKLGELFDVRTFPHLVILDENGKVLTGEGVSIVEEDEWGELPFVPEGIPNIDKLEVEEKERMKQHEEEEDETKWNYSLESLLVSKTMDYLIDNNETKIPVSSLVGKTTILFFGAQWCPPCQMVLGKLLQAYQDMKEKSNNLVEVVFISTFDDDQFLVNEFFAKMPWLGLPFDDDRNESLINLYNVKSVPKLVLIGPTGKTLRTDGCELILCFGADAYPFTSERIEELELEYKKMADLWPEKVRKEVHDHELSLIEDVVGACDDCDEFVVGWAYCCEDCEFFLHPKCALGDVVKEEIAQCSSAMKEIHVLKPEAENKRNDSLESLFVSESRVSGIRECPF